MEQNQTKKGRPFDSGKFDEESFTELVERAYADLSYHYKHTTKKDISSHLGITRATLCRYLNKYISWREVRNNYLLSEGNDYDRDGL